MQNLHVPADTTGEQLMFLYEVRRGSCDRSFGVHVARLAHFPAAIVREAEKHVKQLDAISSSCSSPSSADAAVLLGALPDLSSMSAEGAVRAVRQQQAKVAAADAAADAAASSRI